ncbi:MAG: hypothetical protein RRY65_05495 [Pseudoflavonifractor sp.]
MKANNIKALDYQAQGNALTLTLAETGMDAITGMDTALVNIQTDAGDTVEVFAGYTIKTVLYNREVGTYIATLVREAKDTTAKALDALAAQVAQASAQAAAQSTATDDIMIALAELAGMVTAPAMPAAPATKEVTPHA